MSRTRAALAAAVFLSASACGVSTQDSPRIIEDTSSRPPEPTPTLDTQPPRTTVTETTPTRAPT